MKQKYVMSVIFDGSQLIISCFNKECLECDKTLRTQIIHKLHRKHVDVFEVSYRLEHPKHSELAIFTFITFKII